MRKAFIPLSSAWKVSGTPGDLRRHHGCDWGDHLHREGWDLQSNHALPLAMVGSLDRFLTPPRLTSVPLTWGERPPTPQCYILA